VEPPAAHPALPRWDRAALFPALDSRECADAWEAAGADGERLRALYDEHGVDRDEPRAPTDRDLAAFDAVLAETNRVDERLAELHAYVYSFVLTYSGDRLAQARASELDAAIATSGQLRARFTAWVASLGADRLAAASALAAEHAGPLARLEVRARHQMEPAQEALYSELAVTGVQAWRRLHGDVTSALTATITLAGAPPATMPIASVRNLSADGDRTVRRAAYEAELQAWPSVAVPCAAALNALKGDANVVNTRRHWDDPLDASCYANSTTRETFEAMQAAVDEALPAFRSWLRVKAAVLGHSGGLPWWDLNAPAPVASGTIDFDGATRLVTDAFATYSPALASLVGRAVTERWIDAEPRTGKRGGALCMSFTGDRSLVFLNWADTLDSVQTLAHELGHAYHNVQLAGRTPLQRQLPMTLAETASIFCETVAVDAGLASADDAGRFALLDVDLTGATQVVVDIRSRLTFEAEVFRRRRRRTLSVDELCGLMTEAQVGAYGDGLDRDALHPWMWAVKPHYYNSHFYNWPYTFGLLFGLGLHARFKADPDGFRAGYDELLSLVGMASAEELGRRFDLDVGDVGFWRSSLDVLRARMADYARSATALGLLPTAP
jgi:oligoendopeptidase F